MVSVADRPPAPEGAKPQWLRGAVDAIIYHLPVLVDEVLTALAVSPGHSFIDCTAGEGGHTQAILDASLPEGRVLAIDSDAAALETARRRLVSSADALTLAHGSFAQLDAIATESGFAPAHGILFDLGISSLQLEGSGRGFSFLRDEPLDMRYNRATGPTAAELVNDTSPEELGDVLWQFGEERRSRAIARAIEARRPVTTSAELAGIVARAVGRRQRGIHPATRTFQALRIAVNQELENVAAGLAQALTLLRPGGRLAVISYHSLEDRIVKEMLRRESKDCICPPEAITCVCGHVASLRLINRRVITPSKAEKERNPRSRSARMRAAERLRDDTT